MLVILVNLHHIICNSYCQIFSACFFFFPFAFSCPLSKFAIIPTYTVTFFFDYLSLQAFTRLTNVFDTYNFHVKPSRIYAWDSMRYKIERWEPEQTSFIKVDMLVATNATGYHILPPCVVYADDGLPDVPDFLDLPEAGFVASDDMTKESMSSAILVRKYFFFF